MTNTPKVLNMKLLGTRSTVGNYTEQNHVDPGLIFVLPGLTFILPCKMLYRDGVATYQYGQCDLGAIYVR